MSDYRTHPDYLAHLAGIRAEPADDLPRLVLADWLDEHGHPERADLIRLMVTNQGGAVTLVDVCWSSFCHLSHWDAHRGFVRAVSCTFAEWSLHADCILPESVGLRVRLTDRPPLVPISDASGRIVTWRVGEAGELAVPTHLYPEGIAAALARRWPDVAAWEVPTEFQQLMGSLME